MAGFLNRAIQWAFLGYQASTGARAAQPVSQEVASLIPDIDDTNVTDADGEESTNGVGNYEMFYNLAPANGTRGSILNDACSRLYETVSFTTMQLFNEAAVWQPSGEAIDASVQACAYATTAARKHTSLTHCRSRRPARPVRPPRSSR